MGISNTIATIPGMVGNALTGAILDATGNWSLIFFMAGTAYVLAGLVFYWLADDVDLAELDEKERRRAAGELVGEKAWSETDDEYDEAAVHRAKHAVNSHVGRLMDEDI